MTPTLADIKLDNDAFAERIPHETFNAPCATRPRCTGTTGSGARASGASRAGTTSWPSSRTGATFSSETGATALEDLDPDQIEARKSMLDTDPPEHTRLRAIVNKGFTPRAVAAYGDLLRELTRVILDRALPKGELDFIEDIAKVLPIRVLCEILGVPQEDNGSLIEWGDKTIANTDPDMGGLHPGSPESAEYRLLPFRSPAALEVFEYGYRIAAERRKHPKDDLVSKLVTWEDEDGRRLTEREFDTMFLLLVVAGNETTRQAIAHGMLALMEHPEQMDRLRCDPGLMRTAARRSSAGRRR